MRMTLLPKDRIEEVIAIFNGFLTEEVAPGMLGKRIFLETTLSREDFLPSDIMTEINKLRGNMSVADYLFAHIRFATSFGQYGVRTGLPPTYNA